MEGDDFESLSTLRKMAIETNHHSFYTIYVLLHWKRCVELSRQEIMRWQDSKPKSGCLSLSKNEDTMTRSNRETVQRYYEEVINQKLFDRYEEYFTEETIFHNPPYVGAGVSTDDTSGNKVMIVKVAKGGPADGQLMPGDQLLRASDEKYTWETYKQLRETDWGQGTIGSAVSVRVLRDGNVLDLQLKRGIVQGFNQRAFDIKEIFRHYATKVWPDQKITIEQLIEEGDLVMAHCLNRGTNMEYHRQAVWDVIDLFKVRDGKILEIWSVENLYSELKQLGYKITPPE